MSDDHSGLATPWTGLESRPRRRLLRLLAAGAVASTAPAALGAVAPPGAPRGTTRMATRKIPRSGEAIPVIGMGTSNTFDVGEDAAGRAPLAEVLQGLAAGGGAVIDTSPMYGRAETVLGDLVHDLGLRAKLWLATKVWTRGREAGAKQIEQSFAHLRTQRLELLQVHNLLDWREHLPTIRALQQAGRVRYSGITHYRADAHAELERVPAVRRRCDVRAGKGQAAAALGRRDRLRELGTVLPAVDPREPGRDLCHSRDLEAAAHGGQRRGRWCAAAGRGAASTDAPVLADAISAQVAPRGSTAARGNADWPPASPGIRLHPTALV